MMVMVALAGMGYGFAYLKTRRIEAAVLVHFLVNFTHLLFFSYPMLTAKL